MSFPEDEEILIIGTDEGFEVTGLSLEMAERMEGVLREELADHPNVDGVYLRDQTVVVKWKPPKIKEFILRILRETESMIMRKKGEENE